MIDLSSPVRAHSAPYLTCVGSSVFADWSVDDFASSLVLLLVPVASAEVIVEGCEFFSKLVGSVSGSVLSKGQLRVGLRSGLRCCGFLPVTVKQGELVWR